MKRLFTILATVCMAASMMAEDAPKAINSNIENVNYKIYPTQNMHVFIILDTRDGTLWLTQWSMEDKDRFSTPLSTESRVGVLSKAYPGRFTLVPTTNMFTFIMLDQENGNTWQVQWGFEKKDRLVLPMGIEYP